MYLIFFHYYNCMPKIPRTKTQMYMKKDQLLNLQEQELVWLLALQFYRFISVNVKVWIFLQEMY